MNKGLSPRAQKLLSVSAQGIAKKRGSGQLTPEHVLLGMISDADSLGFEILLYLNINKNQITNTANCKLKQYTNNV